MFNVIDIICNYKSNSNNIKMEIRKMNSITINRKKTDEEDEDWDEDLEDEDYEDDDEDWEDDDEY